MQTTIKSAKSIGDKQSAFYLINKKSELNKLNLSKDEIAFLNERSQQNEYFTILNKLSYCIAVQFVDAFNNKPEHEVLELLRMAGSSFCQTLNKQKQTVCYIQTNSQSHTMAISEGVCLTNYQFLKYKNDKKPNTLKTVFTVGLNQKQIDELNIITEAVYTARDLVNEPVSYLNAVVFAAEMKSLAKKVGIKAEVLNKKQIQSLKMGGLLAVNLGSKTPPTFTILEYKPKNAINKNPLVLVGKGVVYDTGGLSLKPTPNSMDHMKCDMAGGATAVCSIYAIAKAQLPYYVVALIPATDNRPGEIAYTPGDVITMFDGKTVEVLNTDAEGRMLLADALAYAKKYNPDLVLDFATLTGAAAAAIGPYATVFMGTANESTKNKLKEIGYQTHERLAEFPFWDDYAGLLKSDIADMKNIGGPIGGAITAGKFLEKFVDYPWLHFDIAGPAYINSPDGYRPKNGTGVGVRLIFNFVKQLCSK